MDEHFERIPWATLATAERATRWTWYLGGALVVVALAAVVVVLVVADAGVPDPPALGDDVVLGRLATDLAAVDSTLSPVATPLEQPALVPPAAYSEADLMAVAPGPDDLLALAAAEAFVRAYFAGDGAFGDALSDSSGDEAAISYVEWARAFSLEPTSDGYSVAVALQLVVGPLGGPYVRRPLDSVVVELATLDGAPAPVGIPKVAGNGLLGDHVPLEELVPAADVPPGSAAKAVAALGRWGEATVVGGVESATGWAVAVDVKGTSGGRWLLMVETPAEGG